MGYITTAGIILFLSEAIALGNYYLFHFMSSTLLFSLIMGLITAIVAWILYISLTGTC